MSCRDFLARHSEYVDGVIEAAAAERMAAHVRVCASCARYDRVVRRGGALLRELPGITLSSDFEARLRHRLYHERDGLSQRRAGAASVYVAVASVILAIGAAGFGSAVIDRTPEVEGQVVFASVPRPYTPVAPHIFLASASAPASPFDPGPKDADHGSSIASVARGQDMHHAAPAAWPVYSRDAAATAFSKGGAELVVKPAQFRPSSSAHTAGPVLVRH